MSRPGAVVSIRVNPTDCMAIVDLLKQNDMIVKGQSFSSMVSLALSALLEGARVNGVVPERSGFEFNELVRPFLQEGNMKSKRKVTEFVASLGSEWQSKPVAVFTRPLPEPVFQNGTALTERSEAGPTNSEETISTDQRLARRRLSELNARKEMIEDGVQGLTWSTADQIEFDQLMKEVYG